MESTTFLNLDCVRLKNDTLELLVTQSVGPRIIRLSLKGGDNLLAELPDQQIDCPGVGKFSMRGGHRLWHSPEWNRRTYLPDDEPVEITKIENSLHVVQPLEKQTGLQKSLRITLPNQGGTVMIDHTMQNQGLWPIELALWPITQLKTGGTAILPQNAEPADADSLLPNRQLILWPYTDMRSPHIEWGNRFIFIRAAMTEGALKIGFPNSAGWLAYHVDGTLFVKQAAYHADADYFDFGCSTECYCNPFFIELETLSPRAVLEPGQSVTHRETWRIFADIDLEPSEDNVAQLVAELGL